MNKTHWAVLLLMAVAVLSGSHFSGQDPRPSERYEKWLKEEVLYIITPTEKEVFRKLESDKERDLFIEEFWKQRDPTPGTPQNEYKDEHYRRIEYADKIFGRGLPIQGWRTDRGKYYIMLGRPFQVQKYATADIHPIEIWYYHGNPNLDQAPTFRLLFYQRGGSGDFKIYSPVADGPKSLVPFEQRVPEFQLPLTEDVTRLDERDFNAYLILRWNVGMDLAESSLSNIPGRSGQDQMLSSAIFLGEVETYPHKKVDDDYAFEFLEHEEVVEVSYSVHYMGNYSDASVIQDPTGVFFVNYVLVPERVSVDFFEDKYFTNFRVSFRLTDEKGLSIFQGERDVPIELRKEELRILEESSFHLVDSFPLIPGEYKFVLLLENTVTKEFTSFEKNLSVPEAETLELSSLTLARRASADSPPSQSTRAYQVGNLQIFPSVNHTFLEKDTLFLFFQVYGLEPEMKEKGQLEYTVYQEGQPFQTKRRRISEYSSDRDFLEEISLQGFRPGPYTVEVSIVDRNEQKILSERSVFSVSTKPFPGSWIVAQTNLPIEDPYYSYVMGNQSFLKGDVRTAHDRLARAFAGKPDSLDYALNYTRVLMTMKEYRKVRDILIPFEKEGQRSFGLFYTLGRASKEVGALEESIIYYQSALTQRGNVIEVLNAIGECYFELGNTEQALRAWEKSLELNPDQEAVKKMIERIK